MIARIWHGRVSLPKAQEYLRLMREVALPDYKATPGNRGAWCLCRADDREAVMHFDMLSFWESLEAIRRFAGDEVTTAKYYDFDREFLIEMEPSVLHYDAFDH